MGIVRRIAVTATVMLTMLGAGLLSTGGPAAAVVDPPGYPPAYIKNNESGFCMDDYARQGVVYQYPCNPQRNQWWWWSRPRGASDNRWLIHIVEGAIDTCLTARGSAYYSEIFLSRCRESEPRQQWRWVSWGSEWTIQSVDSGKCLGAVVGVTKVVLAECVIRPNVLWRQVPVW